MILISPSGKSKQTKTHGYLEAPKSKEEDGDIMFKDIIKWTIIIIIAAVAFYIVYPKYEFDLKGKYRINRITGEVTEIGR